MTNQELIIWFNNYYNNCYIVIYDNYPESFFMYYDKNYIRKLKLAKLEGKNIKNIEKYTITGTCLFVKEFNNHWFHCNYNIIWNYLKNNYSNNYFNVRSFIDERLNDYSFNELVPIFFIDFPYYTNIDNEKYRIIDIIESRKM